MYSKFTVIAGLVLTSAFFSTSALSSTLKDKRTNSFSYSTALNENEVKQKLLSEFSRWEGVKYKFGGSSTQGIDCSALMQAIYHSAFAEHLPGRLPRTTAQQLTQGISTGKHELRAGDLVFFRMAKNERHVGVYIGDDRFIHASTSQGVMISSLNNDYWDKRYKTARRIMV
ncbi:NlpC/P60 family protein [Enterobacter roggenkampii]|uniref:NlpC/P60 family protein n=1 Tax=Enterobacter roggenkampii TaxID=1812935 RepID=UPI002DB95316|nr:NlpC/P60 family protein [Enterobacter roggenkampii]MEB6622480.1 NlpC/P60 family protein [Enterobacter roggenkampii]